MTLQRNLIPAIGVGVALSIVLWGCREQEPTPTHYRDLGEDVILLPTASVAHDRSMLDGRADFPDFRVPSTTDDTGDTASTNGDPSPAANNAEVEDEIRSLLADYNELADDLEATADDFLEYYPEAQHDSIRPLFESAVRVSGRLPALRSSLEEGLPDQGDRINTAITMLESLLNLQVTVDSVTVTNATEVTAELRGSSVSPSGHFQLIDDEWYLEFPPVTDVEAVKPLLEAAVTKFEGWMSGLNDGSLGADAILSEIEESSKVLAMIQKGLGLFGNVAEVPSDSESDDD